jgi:hypothetical protein
VNEEVVYRGAQHGMPSTLKDQINEDLLAFIEAQRAMSYFAAGRDRAVRGGSFLTRSRIIATVPADIRWLRAQLLQVVDAGNQVAPIPASLKA